MLGRVLLVLRGGGLASVRLALHEEIELLQIVLLLRDVEFGKAYGELRAWPRKSEVRNGASTVNMFVVLIRAQGSLRFGEEEDKFWTMTIAVGFRNKMSDVYRYND